MLAIQVTIPYTQAVFFLNREITEFPSMNCRLMNVANAQFGRLFAALFAGLAIFSPFSCAMAAPVDSANASAGIALDGPCVPAWPDPPVNLKAIGKTLLLMDVDETGAVSHIKLKASSGERALDDAVLNAVAKCRFTPLVQDGIPVTHSFVLLHAWVPGQASEPLRAKSVCDKPKYPEAARRYGQQGTVALKFLIGTDGHVVDAKVIKSSGFDLLDQAALNGLSKCLFEAAKVDGKPVEAWTQVQYVWSLD
jgi:TonB family protein